MLSKPKITLMLSKKQIMEEPYHIYLINHLRVLRINNPKDLVVIFVDSDAVQASGSYAENAFNFTVEKGYLVDVPEGLKQDLQEAELKVFKQKESSKMNT
jgi:hypothetical protein